MGTIGNFNKLLYEASKADGCSWIASAGSEEPFLGVAADRKELHVLSSRARKYITQRVTKHHYC